LLNYRIEKFLEEKMHLFKILLVNLILVESLVCSRFILRFKPFSKEIEIIHSDRIKIILIFIKYAFFKIEQGTFDCDDLKALVSFTLKIIEMKKQYETPAVYWDLRKG
jgi:hypothetical protein